MSATKPRAALINHPNGLVCTDNLIRSEGRVTTSLFVFFRQRHTRDVRIMADVTGEIGSAQQILTGVRDDTSNTGDVPAHGSKQTSWWRRLVGLIWDSVEGDARNRRYVQKLDGFLL